MWEEINYNEAFVKKQIIPPETILSYLSSDKSSSPEILDSDHNWIKCFCSAKKSKWFVEIDEDFLKDSRNYANLKETIFKFYCHLPKFEMFYSMAKHLITTTEEGNPTKEKLINDSLIYSLSEKDEIILESIAEFLYGLLHARYITTNKGLIKMAQKFQRYEFGRCLRVGCKSNSVLPIGLSCEPRCFPVKIFCPLCHDIYNLPEEFEYLENIDGAFFGKTFPSIFMQSFPQFCDESSYIHPNGPAIYKNKAKNEYVIMEENSKSHIDDDAFVPLNFDKRSVLLSNPFDE